MTATPFSIKPFYPMPGAFGAHRQTVAAFLLRPNKGVRYRRHRLELPDGDFIDLDLAEEVAGIPVALPQNAPIALLLHGLEGCSSSTYIIESCKQLAPLGIRPVAMNYRGCSGEPNRTHLFYHAGSTGDVDFVLEWLNQSYPEADVGLIGFSLGANLTLNFLGKEPTVDSRRIKGAAAISPPFDMGQTIVSMELGEGRYYMGKFIASLKAKAQAKADLLADKIDMEKLMQVKTFWELDEIMAPLHGFADADDYYQQTSCRHYLPNIHHPTLIIRSWDDPFFNHDIPEESFAQNDCLYSALTDTGGHVGFVAGAIWRPTFWAEQEAARFLAHLFYPFARKPPP